MKKNLLFFSETVSYNFRCIVSLLIQTVIDPVSL